MAAKIAHRASFLQAFHTGVSESARKDAIDNGTTVEIPTVPVTVTDEDVFTRKMKAGQRVGRGIVRTISDKQIALIKRLINERDLTNLTILPGQTINPDEIGDMGVKGGTALIEKLFNCPEKPSAANNVRMATEGQRNYMRSLNIKAGNPMMEEQILAVTFADVQTTLDTLKSTKPVTPNVGVTEGGYKSGNRVFTVYKARTGSHLLVKEWNGEGWEYVGSVYKLPSDAVRMTLEESQAFGRQYVQCCQCGRSLTKKESIAKGIGPICESKF